MWAICTDRITILTAVAKVHISFKKNRPQEFSGYGPGLIVQMLFRLDKEQKSYARFSKFTRRILGMPTG